MALEYPHRKRIGSVAKEEHVKLVFKIRFVFKKKRVSRIYDFETLRVSGEGSLGRFSETTSVAHFQETPTNQRKAQTVARGGLHS